MGRRGNKKCFPWAYIFIAAGIGLMLSYILPYSLLVTLLGIGLVAIGICFFKRR